MSNNQKSFNRYKKAAIQRNYEFNINKDEFEKIKNNDRYLCEIKNYKKNKNGIDRIINSKGYDIDNIASCCSSCNRFKLNYDYDIFIDKVIKIYNNFINIDN